MTVLNLIDEGPREAPAIVLGHSLGGTAAVWNEVAARLAESWRVIRWELPGHGESGIPEGEPAIETVAQEVLAGLDELGVDRFHVAGISLGGLSAAAIAQQAPDRVESVTILDSGLASPPAGPWHEKAELVRTTGMEPLVDPTMERWFSPRGKKGRRRPRYERTRDAFAACNPEGYAYCCEVLAAADLHPGAGLIQMPTLVMTGVDDPGFTPEQAADLVAELPGATREPVVLLRGARHMTCVEHPKRVANEMESFVAETVLP